MQLKTFSYILSAAVGVGAASVIAFLSPPPASETSADAPVAPAPAYLSAAAPAAPQPAVRPPLPPAPIAAATPASQPPASQPPATTQPPAPPPSSIDPQLAQRLAPAWRIPVSNFPEPLQAQDLPRRRPPRDVTSAPLLLPVDSRRTPRIGPATFTLATLRPRFAPDLIPVTSLDRPAPAPLLPTAPRLRAQDPPPAAAFRFPLAVRPMPEPPGLVSDTSANAATPPNMAPIPVKPGNPAPFVKPTDSNPAEPDTAAPLSPVPDGDPPTSPVGRPPKKL